MASICDDPGGRRRILFAAPDGKRRTLYLGKIDRRAAESVKLRIEALLAAAFSGCPLDAETARWLADLPAPLANKLAKAGLIAPRSGDAPPKTTLAEFLDGYIASRTDVKPNTRQHLIRARDALVAFFGADRPLAAITPGDADDFRRHLLLTLAENTVRRICGRAKQFFRAAHRKRLLVENPFADLKGCSVRPNRLRDYFLSRDDAQRILDACPDAQWRLLFALSRFGGLRCPSEHLALRWSDVDWERDRIRIHSPKTEHHEGKAERWIPLFPELRGPLEEVWQSPDAERSDFVITRYRDANANLRTQFERIIRRAGLTPWPKLFANLRASRATELAGEFPAHVAAAWLGHSTLVAKEHYWQVTDADYERATRSLDTAQKTAQYAHESVGVASYPTDPHNEKSPENPGFTTPYEHLHICTSPQVKHFS